jgi:protein SCO1/2
VTGNRTRRKGVYAHFLMLGAAMMSLSTPSHGAESAAPAVANLPAAGSYVLQRIQRVPEAQLVDADGNPVAISAYVKGAVTALGFFYGHCEDATGCPVAWSTFKAAKEAAAADPLLEGRLRLLFVSLDPARDTPSVLRLFKSAENDRRAPPWLFLTGQSEAQITPLLRAMGQDTGYELDREGRRTGVINHMLKVFLIDPDGWVREIYSTAFLTPENLLNDARTLALAFPDARNRSKEQ